MDTSYREGFFLHKFMKKHDISLRYIDQLALFKMRGVDGISLSVHRAEEKKRKLLNKQLKTLSTIGYYNLKNYANPYFDSSEGKYKNLSFDKLVARYYRDKHLKQAVLHAIEDIETTLNTKIASVLGERYGAYGYTDFRLWCQRNSVNKFLRGKYMDKFAIQKEQINFLKELQNIVRKSYSKDLQDYIKNTEKIYPPIWLVMNELTLGTSIHLYKLMSKSNQRRISSYFGCKTDELVSWLESINLIRNICCHNGILADFKLKTRAKVPKEYKSSSELKTVLLKIKPEVYTNRLAFQLCIIVKLMSKINNNYTYRDLRNYVKKLLDESTPATYYGFQNQEAIQKLFKVKILKDNSSLILY